MARSMHRRARLLCVGERHQVRDRVHRQRRIDHEHERVSERQRDRHQVLSGIVGQRLAVELTLIARVVLVASRMVWPSGADLATKVAPMAVPAPGRLSITNGLPSRCSSRRAEQPGHGLRPAPPGGNGTTRDRSRGIVLGGGRRGQKRRRDAAKVSSTWPEPHRVPALSVARGRFRAFAASASAKPGAGGMGEISLFP